MTDIDRLAAALSDSYTIEHELGAGGMAGQQGQQRAAEGSGGSDTAVTFWSSLTAHRTPHTAL